MKNLFVSRWMLAVPAFAVRVHFPLSIAKFTFIDVGVGLSSHLEHESFAEGEPFTACDDGYARCRRHCHTNLRQYHVRLVTLVLHG